jgi:hypothetical protein
MELEPVLNGVHPLGDGVALVIPGLRVSPRAPISGADSQVRQQGAQRGSTAICEFQAPEGVARYKAFYRHPSDDLVRDAGSLPVGIAADAEQQNALRHCEHRHVRCLASSHSAATSSTVSDDRERYRFSSNSPRHRHL